MYKPFACDQFGRFNQLRGGGKTWAEKVYESDEWKRLKGWNDYRWETEKPVRKIELQTLIESMEHMEEHGVPVTLEIDELPVNPPDPDNPESHIDLYDRKHSGRGKLLLVRTRPREGFRYLHDQEEDPIPEDEMYHLSLCFTNELGKFNLYDWDKGVELGRQAYTRLRDKYHNKPAVVWGHWHNILLDVTHIVTDAGDLFREGDLVALHNAGEYFSRDIHISF